MDFIMKRVLALKMDEVTKKMNEFHILTNDLVRLREMKTALVNVFKLCHSGYIYIFFEREGYKILQKDLELIKMNASQLDDYLAKKV